MELTCRFQSLFLLSAFLVLVLSFVYSRFFFFWNFWFWCYFVCVWVVLCVFNFLCFYYVQLDFTMGYLNKHHSDMLRAIVETFSELGQEQKKKNAWSGGSYQIEKATVVGIDAMSMALDATIQERGKQQHEERNSKKCRTWSEGCHSKGSSCFLFFLNWGNVISIRILFIRLINHWCLVVSTKWSESKHHKSCSWFLSSCLPVVSVKKDSLLRPTRNNSWVVVAPPPFVKRYRFRSFLDDVCVSVHGT